MKRYLALFFVILSAQTFAQKLEKLTIEKIMRDPKWIGTSPENVYWSDDSKKLYFDWNREKADRSVLYNITTSKTVFYYI